MNYICQWNECGKEFPKKKKSVNKYCSQDCYRKDKAEQSDKKEQDRLYILSHQECKNCGETFSNGRKVKYCSDQCKKEATHNMWRVRYDNGLNDKERQSRIESFEQQTYQCKECGDDFTPEYGERRTAYCSERCQRKYIRRNTKYRRRARMKEQYVEPVSLKKIMERDNYICQLCNEPVDMSKEGTSDKLAPSLDHIIPLSKGGEHSYANTQLAHHYCNSCKGNELEVS